VADRKSTSTIPGVLVLASIAYSVGQLFGFAILAVMVVGAVRDQVKKRGGNA